MTPEDTVTYDEDLAQRIREILAERTDVTEKQMFGGLAFMVGGHMTVGVSGTDALMVRVGKDAHDDALALPHARPMDFTGRPMKGFLYVDPAGVASDADLNGWVERCLEFTTSLPPK